MRTRLILSALAGLLIYATSCATKTVVLDSQSDVVRIGPRMRGHVYTWNGHTWERAGKVTLPEGWYAGPGPTDANK